MKENKEKKEKEKFSDRQKIIGSLLFLYLLCNNCLTVLFYNYRIDDLYRNRTKVTNCFYSEFLCFSFFNFLFFTFLSLPQFLSIRVWSIVNWMKSVFRHFSVFQISGRTLIIEDINRLSDWKRGGGRERELEKSANQQVAHS